MTMLASATHPRDSAAHESAIEALAREAHVSAGIGVPRPIHALDIGELRLGRVSEGIARE